ncbi:MAG TPA: adenylate/guanylate cyclase domain-containing protein [Ferruginibacter sp.]|nr:adenylate/guanylate cyclase domain-containing protein [Ferruginibacter sp.]
MFTDIVGYTSMMQQDEKQALIRLNRYRDRLQVKAQEFNGEIIQYFGDGGLVIFTNSADAVNCANDLQEDFGQEPRVPVRIGLHLGDIIQNEGNIFGDCVNITSRIENLGIPGAVLLSEAVQKQVKNKPQFKLNSLGNFDLKNVAGPMEIFALTVKGYPVPVREDINEKFKEQKAVKSIAVLPFVNMSNDPEQEYFSDGMSEEIINSLTHIKDLNVAGRTSSFQFKGKNLDLRQVGKTLNVHAVLEGSVRKQGNQLRITAQLVNVEDGYHLWSERYDREINDVFAIQDEIALAITKKLKITLLKKDHELIIKSYTKNTAAYELYLKGRFYLTRRGVSLKTSIECFEKAIEMDPGFALAHSGYADAYLLLATYGLLPPNPVMTKAKDAAERALQLDPALYQPYCSLGYYYTCFEYNWPEAKKNFLKSIKLNPGYAEGHFRYGWNYLACVEGKFDEAQKYGEIAIKLEPLSSICYATHSLILHCAGKFSEALAICKMGIELDANSFLCHANAGRTYLALHQYENAITSYETAMKLSNRHHFTVNALIWPYCITGRFEEARNLMNELKERSLKEYVAKTFTGISAAYLGDMGEAIDYLEKAYTEKDPILIMLKYEHWVPLPLRKDPRFQNLLQKIGFPE